MHNTNIRTTKRWLQSIKLTKAQCEEHKGDLGIKECFLENDYWAGAVKACGGVQNIPTQAQLTALAEYIYPDADSISSSGTTNANWDADRASLFLAQLPSTFFGFSIWSDEYTASYGYERVFRPTSTEWKGYSRNNNDVVAVCLAN